MSEQKTTDDLARSVTDRAQVVHLQPDDVLRDLAPCPYCALPDGWDACPIHRDHE